MYLRFVLPNKNLNTGFANGVFKSAYALRRGDDLTTHEREELDELLRWFDDNLEVPARFHRKKSKGYCPLATKGVSWLKDSATEHVTKMHRMAAILRDQGYHVSMIRTANPGYKVYEDDHQFVAEPFSDLRD